MPYHNSNAQVAKYLRQIIDVAKHGGAQPLQCPDGVALNTAAARCRDVIRRLITNPPDYIDAELLECIRTRVTAKELSVFFRDGMYYLGNAKDASHDPVFEPVALPPRQAKLPAEVVHAISVAIVNGLVESYELVGYTADEARNLIHPDAQLYTLGDTLIISQ